MTISHTYPPWETSAATPWLQKEGTAYGPHSHTAPFLNSSAPMSISPPMQQHEPDISQANDMDQSTCINTALTHVLLLLHTSPILHHRDTAMGYPSYVQVSIHHWMATQQCAPHISPCNTPRSLSLERMYHHAHPIQCSHISCLLHFPLHILNMAIPRLQGQCPW
jgi:hypothetical protein